MSQQKDIIKNIFLGDDLGIDFGGFNFSRLGLSLSDININETDINNANNQGHQDCEEAAEEPLSDMSDEDQLKDIIAKPIPTVSQQERKTQAENIKAPLNVSRKEKLTKIQSSNSNPQNSHGVSPSPNNSITTQESPVNQSQTKTSLNPWRSSRGTDNRTNKDSETEKHAKQESKDNLNEKDLNLDLICVHNGEKIYRLSDLFVPLNENCVRRIEKYVSRQMNNTEKENKNEQPQDQPVKKDVNETLELKHLIKKSKKNQKYQKINFTYNEKYFDKTFFVDNININNSLADSLFKSAKPVADIEEHNNCSANMEKDNFIYNPKNSGENEKESREIVERNLLNSIFHVKMLLDKNKHQGFNKTIKPNPEEKNEEEEHEEITSEVKPSIPIDDELEYEKNEINNFNELFAKNSESVSLENDIDDPPNHEFMEILNNKPVDMKESSFLQQNLEGGKKSGFSRSGIESIKKFPTNEMDASVYSGIEILRENNNMMSQLYKFKDPVAKPSVDNDTLFGILKAEDYTEKEILFDRFKRKRYRQTGYVNSSLKNGDFKSAILVDPQDSKTLNNFKVLSKRIFDMNDYNMNLELLKVNLNGKKEGQNQEEYLSNLCGKYNQTLTTNSNNTLKIGKSKINILTHAKCAYNLTYYKINLTEDEIREFHRPNICRYFLKEKKKKNFSFTISENFDISNSENTKRWNASILTRNYLKKREKKRISKNIQYMNAYEIFKDRFKLSLVEGKFVLFEHIDEYPIFVSNFGMASKLKKYIYSNKLFNSSASNPNLKLSETELKTKSIIGPFGAQILLQPNKNPLLGHIDQNELKGITVVDNNIYRAPAFYEKFPNISPQHKPVEKKEKKYMNFIITFKKGKDGKEGVFIREMEHLYVIGQEEPKLEVYPPQSKQYNNFLKKKIQTYTYKLYNEIGFNAGINFKVFSNLFPNVTEQILKKNFREMKIEIDKNICYYTKVPTEDNNMQITPENICQYESSQFGLSKLREMGIKTLTNPEKISYSTNKFIQQVKNSEEQFLARVIEAELLSTPWNITQNFLNAKQTKGMLSIKGIGDPSNGHGGYSFLKMPVKSYNENNKSIKEEIDNLKKQNNNLVKTVTGTDADLRKLSKEDIRLKLIQLGIEDDYINKLSRWERVSVLRYKSTQVASIGYEGDMRKYARGTRMSSKVQREAYQNLINETFKKQIKFISTEPSEEELIDDDVEEEVKNMNYNKPSASNYEDSQVADEKPYQSNFASSSLKNKKKQKNRHINDPNKKADDKIMQIYRKNNQNKPSSINQNNNSEGENSVAGNTKIKFDIGSLGVDIKYLKNKTNKDPNFEYEDKTTNFGSRKRRDTTDKILNEIFEDIVDACIKADQTKIFHKPVKKKDYPDYYQIIAKPIDLGEMKNKTKRSEYKTKEQFMDDVNLLVKNCEVYNGDTHEVTRQAYKILEVASEKVDCNKDKIEDLERQVNTMPIII